MTSTASRFSDEVALVTGATSGIGAACARLLAARGARVQLTGRDQDRGSDLNAELRRAGGDTDFVAADLRESGACDRVVEHTLTRFGRIDVLVNSAGIYVAATTPETTDEMWNETLDTNLGAVF